MPEENASATGVVDQGGAPPAAPVKEAAPSPFEFDDPTVERQEAAAADGDPGADGKGKGAEDSGIADDLRTRAESYGLSKDEIDSYSADPAFLERTLGLMDRRFAELGRQAAGRQPAGQEEAGREAGKDGKAGKESAPSEEKFKFNLKPEDFDKALLDELNRFAEHLEGRFGTVNKPLKADLDTVLSDLRSRRAEEGDRELDNMFKGLSEDKDKALGDGWKKLFGQGGIRGLRKNSAEARMRIGVVAEMEAMAAGYQSLGMDVPSRAELFNRALRVLHSDVFAQQTRKQISSTLTKRSGQVIGRPAARKSEDIQSPEQKAVATVTEKLKEIRGQ